MFLLGGRSWESSGSMPEITRTETCPTRGLVRLWCLAAACGLRVLRLRPFFAGWDQFHAL